MVMPNMEIAPDNRDETVEIFYDAALKNLWGIRKIDKIVKDGVWIETTKCLTMTKEQLLELIEDAKDFVK